MNIINTIKEQGIIAVIRADEYQQAIVLAKAISQGGIKLIEITYTVPNAHLAINELAKDQNMIVGAGTILIQEDAKEAINNGAKFIVGPNFNQEVLQICMYNNIPYFPGCMTVQEITNALDAGIEIIKLFPANLLGPQYLKALRGPLPNLQIMPTGGVNIDNLKDWFKVGAIAVGVGGELTSIGKTKGLDALAEAARAYIDEIKAIRQ